MSRRTQLYLEESQYQFLKDLARSEGKSIAQIIREWVDERRQGRILKKYLKDPLWKLRGLGASGQSDIAKNFDKYLYGKK